MHEKSILVTRNQFLSQEINSCHKISILVTRNQFLWAHILQLNLSIRDNAWILSRVLALVTVLWCMMSCNVTNLFTPNYQTNLVKKLTLISKSRKKLFLSLFLCTWLRISDTPVENKIELLWGQNPDPIMAVIIAVSWFYGCLR